MSGGRERRTRSHGRSLAAALATLLLAACAGPIAPPPSIAAPDTPGPSQSAGAATPAATAPARPTPTPRPTSYRIRSRDTLIAIAQRFGLSLAQLVHANPTITNPDSIQVGAVLVIPSRQASTGLPRTANLSDPANDMVDLSGFATVGQSYADILHFEADIGSQDLAMEILLLNSPPPADPSVETVTYTINIDADGDGEPDYTLLYGNALPGQLGYAASLQDRKLGIELAGSQFPGTVSVLSKTVRLTLPRVALGDSAQYALAAEAERQFFPGGPGDSDTEASVDLDPNQQWPHPNARWLEIGR